MKIVLRFCWSYFAVISRKKIVAFAIIVNAKTNPVAIRKANTIYTSKKRKDNQDKQHHKLKNKTTKKKKRQEFLIFLTAISNSSQTV